MTSLADQILGLSPEPEAVGAVTGALLRCLREGNAGAEVGVDDLAAYFVEETTRLGLDWMGAGARDEIQALLERLHEAFREEGAGRPPLSSLPVAERFEARLRELGRILEVYLRLDNVARYTAELSGARRANWRRILAWMYDDDRTVRTSDIVEAALYNRRNSAHDALEALAERGYLEKREEGQREVSYRLTWSGRVACEVALTEEDFRKTDAEPPPAPSPSEVEPEHSVEAPVSPTTGVELGESYRARLASYQRGIRVQGHTDQTAPPPRPFRVAVADFPNGRLLRFAWARQRAAASRLARPVEVSVVPAGAGLFDKLGQGHVDAVLGNLEATEVRPDREYFRFVGHGLSLYRGSAILVRAGDVSNGGRFSRVQGTAIAGKAVAPSVARLLKQLDGCRVLATGTTGHERTFRKLVAGIDYDIMPELVEAPDRVEGIRQFLQGDAEAYLGGISERFLAEWLSGDEVVELLSEDRVRLGLQEQNGLVVRAGVTSSEWNEVIGWLSGVFFATVEEIEEERVASQTGHGAPLIEALLDEVNKIDFLASVDGFRFGREHFERWWGPYEEFFSSPEEAEHKTRASIKANEEVIVSREPVEEAEELFY